MEIQSKFLEAGLLVSLTGVLHEAAATSLQKRLEGVIWYNRHFLLLDFANVTQVTAAGLRLLLPSVQQVQEKNCEFIVINLNEEILALFKKTGFNILVTIKDSLDTANTYIAKKYNNRRK
ncbi:STAS domain-containing protein [Rufibacter immobilis]|uniref:STAS domain-containing protein n=1 Tax=Rufibacter immobilis TaxID=1348778 RepID=A0A3M9N289_9BACT|nr:STAS domain-containing protein [Rufibacter immobilis]RNI31910.1 STAS domain-containing protein [Rufibacter immobilis]